MSLLYIFFGIPHMLIGLAMLVFADGPKRFTGIFFLFAPIFMWIFGYIGIALTSLVYNFLASKVGGIEFEIIEVDEESNH